MKHFPSPPLEKSRHKYLLSASYHHSKIWRVILKVKSKKLANRLSVIMLRLQNRASSVDDGLGDAAAAHVRLIWSLMALSRASLMPGSVDLLEMRDQDIDTVATDTPRSRGSPPRATSGSPAELSRAKRPIRAVRGLLELPRASK